MIVMFAQVASLQFYEPQQYLRNIYKIHRIYFEIFYAYTKQFFNYFFIDLKSIFDYIHICYFKLLIYFLYNLLMIVKIYEY